MRKRENEKTRKEQLQTTTAKNRHNYKTLTFAAASTFVVVAKIAVARCAVAKTAHADLRLPPHARCCTHRHRSA